MATASASAASGPAILVPGSRRDTIAWIWALPAPPVPTTAFLTSDGAYSPTAIPARAADVERVWGFLFDESLPARARLGPVLGNSLLELPRQPREPLRQRGQR